MATTITDGTVTSFANTPQAKDDVYLASVTGLTEDSSTIVWFNVLANDLGGAAKVLYSLDDGTSSGGTASTDLLAQDLGRTEALSTDTSAGGAKIWISSDGKLGYDSSTLSSAFRTQLQSLNAGEYLTDSFTYAIRMSSGALSWATVTVQFSGANDAPVVTGVVAGNAVEDGSLVTLYALTNASDVDAESTLSVVDVPDSLPAGVTYNAATKSFTLDPANAAYQHLADGQPTTVTVNYGVSDGTVTTAASVSFTITGTNDGPVAVADVAAGTENQTLTIDVLANDEDVDDGHVFTLNTVSAPADKGTASVVANQVQFNPGTDFDHLAQGASEVVTLSYEMRDEHGAISTNSVDVTITGTNDAPVAVADTNSGNEDATITGTVATNDDDVDDGAVLTYSLNSAVAGLTLETDGSYSFDAGDAAYQNLAQGATQDVVANYMVTDEDGATGTSTLTITLTGTNDAPVAVADTSSGSEDGTITGTVVTNDSDVDDGAVLTYGLNALVAGLALATDGSYSFDAGNAAYQHVALDATTDVVANYTVTDEFGATGTSTLTITLTGTNDDPVAAADTTSGNEDATITGTVATNDDDVDDGAALTYSLNAAVAGLTLETDGNYSFDASNAAYQHLAQGATTDVVANYTVTDEYGATGTSTLTITLTGTNDVPVLAPITSPAALQESANASAQDFAAINGTLSVADADVGDTLSTLIAATPTLVWSGGALTGTQTTALTAALSTGKLSFGDTATSNGGAQTINWTWDPTAADLDFLAEGQTLTVTYGLKVNDGSADSTVQNLSFTINGTNDAASDLIFSLTGSAGGNSLPNGGFGQMSLIDPDGGTPSYTYSLVGLTANTLSGGGATGFAGDLSVSADGVISASTLDSNRVYEMSIQVTQGAATFSETISVITGTNAGDTIDGAYANGDDVIFAQGNADTILAGSGNDTVLGQVAEDQIHGGTGNDKLSGGGGNDTFYFDTTLNSSTNVDTITDFNANTGDKIALDQTIFTMLTVNSPLAPANFVANAGGVAADANDHVLYDTDTGNLYYDADGNGAGVKVMFAALTLPGISGTVDSTDFTVLS